MKNIIAIILLNKKLFILLSVLLLAIILFLFLFSNQSLSVLSAFPNPGTQNVEPDVNPYVIFSKSLSKQQQGKLLLKSSPPVNFSQYWSSDGKTLYLVPGNSLSPNTNYGISISYPVSYSWSFKTKGAAIQPNQGSLDNEYNNALENFYKLYPWYNKLPPKNNDFSIIFDPQTKKFLIELYPQTSSGASVSEQTNELKTTVLKTLGDIGVDVSNYSFNWTIVPR